MRLRCSLGFLAQRLAPSPKVGFVPGREGRATGHLISVLRLPSLVMLSALERPRITAVQSSSGVGVEVVAAARAAGMAGQPNPTGRRRSSAAPRSSRFMCRALKRRQRPRRPSLKASLKSLWVASRSKSATGRGCWGNTSPAAPGERPCAGLGCADAATWEQCRVGFKLRRLPT